LFCSLAAAAAAAAAGGDGGAWVASRVPEGYARTPPLSSRSRIILSVLDFGCFGGPFAKNYDTAEFVDSAQTSQKIEIHPNIPALGSYEFFFQLVGFI
jgi:hypothetical protein